MLDEPKKRYSRKREQRKIKFDILNAFADKLNLPHTWEWSRSPHIEPPNFLSTEDVRRFYERACPEPYDDKEKLKELKKAIINSYEKSKTFFEVLMQLKNEKGIKKDSDLYKSANVLRKTFHLIKSNPFYCPSKQTIMAFVVALRLDEEDARALFSSAGIALCSYRADDTLYDYLIRSGILKRKEVDVTFINELLDELQLPLIGSGLKEEKMKKTSKDKHNTMGARIRK